MNELENIKEMLMKIGCNDVIAEFKFAGKGRIIEADGNKLNVSTETSDLRKEIEYKIDTKEPIYATVPWDKGVGFLTIYLEERKIRPDSIGSEKVKEIEIIGKKYGFKVEPYDKE